MADLPQPLPQRPKVRVLVCGGRYYKDRERVFFTLTKLTIEREIVILIHGGASGADSLADEWARTRCVPRMVFPISSEEWQFIGPSAGPKRNARMLLEGRPTLVVAFPGQDGARDMCMRARAAGVPLWLPFKGVLLD